MLKRRTPLRRKTPLASGGKIERRSRVNPVSDRRKIERAEYRRERLAYLALHPYCQIFIARHELSESAVLAASGRIDGIMVPIAKEIHHRNKADGLRLIDKRWWMAASRSGHEWVERHKDDARALGYLLPINADIDGRWGDGNQALTTHQFMHAHARPKPEEEGCQKTARQS